MNAVVAVVAAAPAVAAAAADVAAALTHVADAAPIRHSAGGAGGASTESPLLLQLQLQLLLQLLLQQPTLSFTP